MSDERDDYYELAGLQVEIRSALTLAQFRAVERLLDRPPARHKEWSEKFVFTLDESQPFVTMALLEYLREQKLPHEVERQEVWEP